MIEPKPEQKTKSLAERLPKIGRVSQVILIVGVLVIIFIALYMVGAQQVTQQDELRVNITTLQRGFSTGSQIEPRDKMQAQIRQAEAETEAARATFPEPDQLTEIMDRLIKLANSYDIEVTSTGVTMTKKELTIGGAKVAYDVYTLSLALQGMASNFQNFLLSLDKVVATSRINQVTIKLALVENERDTATVSIDVYCY